MLCIIKSGWTETNKLDACYFYCIENDQTLDVFLTLFMFHNRFKELARVLAILIHCASCKVNAVSVTVPAGVLKMS